MSRQQRHLAVPSPEAAVAAWASEQEGIVSRAQVLAAGYSDDWVEARLQGGRWQRVHLGTYAVFTGPLPFRSRLVAALERCGPGAMAWAGTAAYLDGLTETEPEPLEILVPAGRRVRAGRGFVVRRSRQAAERRHPARRPARTRIEDTVLDLCDRATSFTEVAAWVSRACGRRLTTPERLRASLRQRARHRWRRELMDLLGDVAAGAQSPLELRYLREVERAHGLPPGVRQRRLAGRTVRWVDVDLAEFGVRVELDGRLGHVDEGAFRDRVRDNAATVSGRATLRYGWVDVVGTPCAVAAEVAQVLRSRGWAGKPVACGPYCRISQ
jgi:hypothetical protein